MDNALFTLMIISLALINNACFLENSFILLVRLSLLCGQGWLRMGLWWRERELQNPLPAPFT